MKEHENENSSYEENDLDFDSIFTNEYVIEDDDEEINHENVFRSSQSINYKKDRIRDTQLSDYEIIDNRVLLKNRFGETLKTLELKTDEDYENGRKAIRLLHSYRMSSLFLLLCLPFFMTQLGNLKKLDFLYFLALIPTTILSTIFPSLILWGIIISLPYLLGWEHKRELQTRKIFFVAIVVFLITSVLLFFSPIVLN